MISQGIHILTEADLAKIKTDSFAEGVRRGKFEASSMLQTAFNPLDEMTQDRDQWKLKCEDMAARNGNPGMDRIIATSERLGDTGMPPDDVEEVQEMLDASVIAKFCDGCSLDGPTRVGSPCALCSGLNTRKNKSSWDGGRL